MGQGGVIVRPMCGVRHLPLPGWARVTFSLRVCPRGLGVLIHPHLYRDLGWYSEHRFISVLSSVLTSVLSTRVTTPLKRL